MARHDRIGPSWHAAGRLVFVSFRVGEKVMEQIAIPAPRLDTLSDAIHRSLVAHSGPGGECLSLEAVQERLLRICLAAPPVEPSAIWSLGLWLAYPNGGYREGAMETVRRHGKAHITVQTDRLGREWGFAVSTRQVDLTHFLLETMEREGGRSRALPLQCA